MSRISSRVEGRAAAPIGWVCSEETEYKWEREGMSAPGSIVELDKNQDHKPAQKAK